MNRLFLLILISQIGCSSQDRKTYDAPRGHIHQAEYIYRVGHEYLFIPDPPDKQGLEPYPWEKDQVGSYPKITREFFRCKGSAQNPVRVLQGDDEVQRYQDCGGFNAHSLPLNEGRESIYPILIDLMNYLQVKTGKRIVITSGHRCPEHNAYVDPSRENRYSKHQIGAEVSFYIQGLEEGGEEIVQLIKNYYLEKPEYHGSQEYEEFQRYEGETNVSIKPWMNKEVFIKLFGKKEGRNLDNRHPYPYVSIQVRYDKEKGERVMYTWEKAYRNYLRK